MSKCEIEGCINPTQYINTKNKYCSMHMARIRRHGYPELKKERGEHSLEKLPHKIIDDFILKNHGEMIDKEIVEKLIKMGFEKANNWNIGYRRRKLGVKKYLYGEIKKHKAWIRSQAIKKYGNNCELCSYQITVDAHHIIPKHKKGPHEVENLMIVCPNCHALITRKIIEINQRKDIPKISSYITNKIKSFYSSL